MERQRAIFRIESVDHWNVFVKRDIVSIFSTCSQISWSYKCCRISKWVLDFNFSRICARSKTFRPTIVGSIAVEYSWACKITVRFENNHVSVSHRRTISKSKVSIYLYWCDIFNWIGSSIIVNLYWGAVINVENARSGSLTCLLQIFSFLTWVGIEHPKWNKADINIL